MNNTPDPDVLARLAELEHRVADLEDERAIRNLITRYGYVADFGSVDDYVALFTPDGALDLAMGSSYGEFALNQRWEGSAELHRYLADPDGLWDKSWYGNVMHVQGNNLEITVDGVEAVATGYAFSIISRDEGLHLIGASNNRWQLRRNAGEWLVHERKFRPVGHEEFAAMVLGEGRVRASDRG